MIYIIYNFRILLVLYPSINVNLFIFIYLYIYSLFLGTVSFYVHSIIFTIIRMHLVIVTYKLFVTPTLGKTARLPL